MRIWRVVLAVLAIGAIAAFAWQQRGQPDVAPNEPVAAPGDGSATPATANPNATPDEAGKRTPGEVGSTSAPPPAATFQLGLQLRVRLRGLHPAAAWGAQLHLRIDGLDTSSRQWFDHSTSVAPDERGEAVFALPDWYGTVISHDHWITGHAESYRELRERWQGASDLGQERIVDVQVVAMLYGSVFDSARRPVDSARVTAFALRDGVPTEPELARSPTAENGRWVLRVPPDVPVFVLATPMQPSVGRYLEHRGDNGALRTDLLPASITARGVVGAGTAVPDLVLAPAIALQGHVRWLDGEGIQHALVRTLADEGVPLRLSDLAAVQRDPSGLLLPRGGTSTDRSGAFTLAAVPGRPQGVQVERLHEMHLLTPVQATAVPPQPIDLRLPRPIRLRALHRGAAQSHAIVELDGRGSLATNEAGVVDVVTTTALRVRGARERLRSAWLDVPADAAGTTIDLQLTDERVAVAIDFDGDVRVRNTEIHWRNDRGEQGRQHLARDDRSGPFQLFLEPGRYVLTAGPGGGERNGVFLLPVEREIEVATTPVELRLPATFGGTFTLMATDSSGLHLGGTCRVYDVDGTDRSGAFEVHADGEKRQGKPGELLPGGTNHFTGMLPPGTYDLAVEFLHHGAVPQRVTIRPREVAEVRIRLP